MINASEKKARAGVQVYKSPSVTPKASQEGSDDHSSDTRGKVGAMEHAASPFHQNLGP